MSEDGAEGPYSDGVGGDGKLESNRLFLFGRINRPVRPVRIGPDKPTCPLYYFMRSDIIITQGLVCVMDLYLNFLTLDLKFST